MLNSCQSQERAVDMLVYNVPLSGVFWRWHDFRVSWTLCTKIWTPCIKMKGNYTVACWTLWAHVGPTIPYIHAIYNTCKNLHF